MLKKQYLKTKPICKVTFSLPLDAVSESSEVLLLGDFNDWNWDDGVIMKAGKTEYKATLELETGRDYEFRYLVNKTSWRNDHSADAYVPSPYVGIDNSVVSLEKKPEPKPAKATKPAKKAPAPKTAADNLKKIEGIGPKIEGLLKAAGITTFEALSKAKKKTLEQILTDAGPRFRMHDPATWTKQAGLAAKGKWDKLQTLQDELKGGRKK